MREKRLESVFKARKKSVGKSMRECAVGSERQEKKPEKTTGWSSLGLGKKSGKELVRGIPTQEQH